MNTRINYIYRDASNYKAGNTVVFRGEITEEQKNQILSCCDEGEYFIPRQVGMPENRFEDITEDDHPWFELEIDGFELTDAEPDTPRSVDDLVMAFARAKDSWDTTGFPGNAII